MPKTVSSLFIILVFFCLRAQAQVSIYEYAQQGKGSVLGLTPVCIQQIKNIPRKDLDLPELRKTVALKELNIGTHLYHYTTVPLLQTLLKSDVPDRAQAQTEIERDGGLVAIMEHSLSSNGLVGPGFYMAANPFSSIDYGAIQVSFDLDPETRVLVQDYHQYKPEDLVDGAPSLKLGYIECGKVFISLLLQESGVEMMYYNQNKEWFLLLDTSMVKETAVLTSVRIAEDALKEMLRANRTSEIRGLADVIYSVLSLDENSRWQLAEIILRERTALDVGGLIQLMMYYPSYWKNWEGKDEMLRAALTERPNDFLLQPEVAKPLSDYLCPRMFGQGNKVSIASMAKKSQGDARKKIQSLQQELCAKKN